MSYEWGLRMQLAMRLMLVEHDRYQIALVSSSMNVIDENENDHFNELF